MSYDGGKNFEVVNNFPFTQFYHINYDMQKPYMVCGGLQDNGTWCGPSNSLLSEGIRKNDWFTVGGGDGFFAVPDLKEPWRVYTDLQGGVISVTDTRSGTREGDLSVPEPDRLGRRRDGEPQVPLQLELADRARRRTAQTVYFGGNVLFKSTEPRAVVGGDQPGSHDERQEQAEVVGRPDRRRQHRGGVPLHHHHDRAVDARLERHLGRHRRWQRAGDARRRQDVDERGQEHPGPRAERVDSEPSKRRTSTPARRTSPADHHQDDDYTPYVFMTTDYGKTWTRLNLGAGEADRLGARDPRGSEEPAILYAGTEIGVWVSCDGGAHWTSLRQNMPPVPVRDIQVHPRDNDLIVATHGRGLYILDDITPLQHIARGDEDRREAVRHTAGDALDDVEQGRKSRRQRVARAEPAERRHDQLLPEGGSA